MSGFLNTEELIYQQQAQLLNVRLDNIDISSKLETCIFEAKTLKNKREVQRPMVAARLKDKTDFKNDEVLGMDPDASPDT